MNRRHDDPVDEGAPAGGALVGGVPGGDAPEPGHTTATAEQSTSGGDDLPRTFPAGDPEAPVGPVAYASEKAIGLDAPGHGGPYGHERDLETLTAKAEKADQYLELAQRTKADFENYRKRALREARAAEERGVVKLARELLPAVDNLDRALAAAEAANPEPGQDENGADTLISGIKLVHADVIAALARAGIEAFSPQGEQFDPQHHEAVAQQPVDGTQAGTIVEVYQRGYRLGESVLRPARVVVAG
jgi:molecular chaperone GrpE